MALQTSLVYFTHCYSQYCISHLVATSFPLLLTINICAEEKIFIGYYFHKKKSSQSIISISRSREFCVLGQCY